MSQKVEAVAVPEYPLAPEEASVYPLDPEAQVYPLEAAPECSLQLGLEQVAMLE